MAGKFDKNDVLRFLYEEMAQAEKDEFLTALTEDDNLWNEYESMQSSAGLLDGSELSPSSESINRIQLAAKAIGANADFAGHTQGSVHALPEVPASPIHTTFRFRQLVSALMIVAATGGLAIMFLGLHKTDEQEIISESNQRLQWESPFIDTQMNLIRSKIRNHSGSRESLTPVSENTYRVIKPNEFANETPDLVLVNLR